MMKGILIVLLVLLLGNVILLYLLAPRLSGRRRVHPFFGVKWAHRGLHDIKKGIPENSIPAFQAAIEAGYGIELDVHLTKDGKLVVFHDDDFRRICGEKGKVEETDYARMRTYRLSRTGEKIPLLSEVLRLVDTGSFQSDGRGSAVRICGSDQKRNCLVSEDIAGRCGRDQCASGTSCTCH